jgi:2-hydroxycyclohexanecarboxyl-CoA dehydrogenase
MRGLDGRRVVLTGGASGIGRAAALRLADEGCVLGIFDLDEAGAQETAARCAGGQARAYRVDITDRAGIEAAVAAFEATCGAVQGLANIAGWIRHATPSIPTARCGTASSRSICTGR